MSQKKEHIAIAILKGIGKVLWFILKIIFVVLSGIFSLLRSANKAAEKQANEQKAQQTQNEIIASVIQKGNSIYVYNERGGLVSVRSIDNGMLQGYTSTTYSVRKQNTVYIYNAKGNFLSQRAM
ncbi:MAG: hypothetical protein LBU90_07090 [Bacteroidales bacterium]|nr:hypothetical protein [Bacteroidales bacterium]